MDASLAFRGLLLEQVFPVHFGPLELILDVTGVVRGGPFDPGGVPRLLALEAGVAAFRFGWGHGVVSVAMKEGKEITPTIPS